MSKDGTDHKFDKRLMDLQNWLADNVQIFKKAKTVKLSDFKLEPPGYRGSFVVSLDDVPINSRFEFTLGANGLPVLSSPIFGSPLGVPASFSAVELSDNITAAIKDLLKEVLPGMKALGYHRETDEYVFSGSKDANRIISLEEFETKMAKLLEPNFEVSAKVSSDNSN
jgi:hypothetical protein